MLEYNHGISYSRGFSKENNPQLSSRELSQLNLGSMVLVYKQGGVSD